MGSGAAQGGVKVTRLGSKYIYHVEHDPRPGRSNVRIYCSWRRDLHDTKVCTYRYVLVLYTYILDRLSYILACNAIYIQGGYILVWL